MTFPAHSFISLKDNHIPFLFLLMAYLANVNFLIISRLIMQKAGTQPGFPQISK